MFRTPLTFGHPMKLQLFFDTLYRPQRLLGKSPNTTRLYNLSIRSFGKTVGTDPTMDHLTDENIVKHMQRVVDLGRSPATANKDRDQVLTLWRHAHRLGLVSNWPNPPRMIEPERTPKAWLPEEFAKLMETIDSLEGYFVRVPQSLWWRTIVMVCLDTGERITAIRQAKWDWISGEWFLVPAEARKGSRRDRSYRLRDETLGHLMAIRMVSPKKPFHLPYCDMYLWTLFGKILEKAGLPNTRRDKFHKIRRTTGSVAHAAGLDAQEVLDHQYRRTTKRYLDPRFTRDRQACDVLADYLANPQPKDERQTG